MKGILVMSWMVTVSTPPGGSLSQTYRLSGLEHVSGTAFMFSFCYISLYTLFTHLHIVHISGKPRFKSWPVKCDIQMSAKDNG